MLKPAWSLVAEYEERIGANTLLSREEAKKRLGKAADFVLPPLIVQQAVSSSFFR
jgi:hypothetical protein